MPDYIATQYIKQITCTESVRQNAIIRIIMSPSWEFGTSDFPYLLLIVKPMHRSFGHFRETMEREAVGGFLIVF